MPASQENRSDVSSQGCGDTGGSLPAANQEACAKHTTVWLREIDGGTPNACWVVCAKGDPGGVQFTNGAPELLEALKSAASALRGTGLSLTMMLPYASEQLLRLAAEADAVISKAEGQ